MSRTSGSTSASGSTRWAATRRPCRLARKPSPSTASRPPTIPQSTRHTSPGAAQPPQPSRRLGRASPGRPASPWDRIGSVSPTRKSRIKTSRRHGLVSFAASPIRAGPPRARPWPRWRSSVSPVVGPRRPPAASHVDGPSGGGQDSPWSATPAATRRPMLAWLSSSSRLVMVKALTYNLRSTGSTAEAAPAALSAHEACQIPPRSTVSGAR
jgi:hypothetical protein